MTRPVKKQKIEQSHESFLFQLSKKALLALLPLTLTAGLGYISNKYLITQQVMPQSQEVKKSEVLKEQPLQLEQMEQSSQPQFPFYPPAVASRKPVGKTGFFI